MSIKSIANIINDTLNEYESPEDVDEIFCIGNFAHSESRKCDDLMAEAASHIGRSMVGKMILPILS